jgi:hypothetical protein
MGIKRHGEHCQIELFSTFFWLESTIGVDVPATTSKRIGR